MEAPNLTKREAIRECKRLWKEIVKSGLSKWRFLGSDAGEKWRKKGYILDCPLCGYAWTRCGTHCPLYLQYGKGCDEMPYDTDPKAFYEYVKGLKE